MTDPAAQPVNLGDSKGACMRNLPVHLFVVTPLQLRDCRPGRRWLGVALCCLVGLSATHRLAAQPPGFPGFGRGFSTALFLVRAAEVRQELGLSQEQHELLNDLQEDLADQIRGVFSQPSTTPREPNDEMRERRAKVRELSRQTEELVRAVLEPAQNERLVQLVLQREGARAFDRAEFTAALKLTDEQREQIQKARAENRSPETRLQLDTEISKILTAEQRAEWSKRKGLPFDFPERLSNAGRWPGGRPGRPDDPPMADR